VKVFFTSNPFFFQCSTYSDNTANIKHI